MLTSILGWLITHSPVLMKTIYLSFLIILFPVLHNISVLSHCILIFHPRSVLLILIWLFIPFLYSMHVRWFWWSVVYLSLLHIFFHIPMQFLDFRISVSFMVTWLFELCFWLLLRTWFMNLSGYPFRICVALRVSSSSFKLSFYAYSFCSVA